MSEISTIYDDIKSLFSTTFPSKTEMYDPIDIENNDDFILKDGYGIDIGPGNNTNRFVSKKISVNRAFTFTLSKEIQSVNNDLSLRNTVVKEVFEDQKLILDIFEKQTVSASIAKSLFISDGGVEYLLGEKNYIVLQTTLDIEYIENL